MKILIDAMGGDNAPLEVIKGTMLAVDEFNIDEIVLLGDEGVIKKCVEDNKLTLKNTTILQRKWMITMKKICLLKMRSII